MERIDRRIQKSRALIKSALLDLLMEKKFSEITIQEITDRANVGRATFYLHYKNKEECLNQVLTQGFDEFVAEIDLKANEVGRKPIEVIEKIFNYAYKNRKFYLTLLRDNPSLDILTQTQEYILDKMIETIDLSEVESKSTIQAIGIYLTGALSSMLLWWLRDNPMITAHQMAVTFIEIAQQGIDNFSASKLNTAMLANEVES